METQHPSHEKEDEDFVRMLRTQVLVELAERDMTQQDLADAMGIGKAQLSRYLNGKTAIPLGKVREMAGALGMGAGELLARVEDRLENL